MNLINILNSNKFDEHSRSEVMLILADQLEDCGDVLTAEALRWAEERGRWVTTNGNVFAFRTYNCAHDIKYKYEVLANDVLNYRQEDRRTIFEAFRQLGKWLDEGFVIRDFEYPKKEVVA